MPLFGQMSNCTSQFPCLKLILWFCLRRFRLRTCSTAQRRRCASQDRLRHQEGMCIVRYVKCTYIHACMHACIHRKFICTHGTTKKMRITRQTQTPGMQGCCVCFYVKGKHIHTCIHTCMHRKCITAHAAHEKDAHQKTGIYSRKVQVLCVLLRYVKCTYIYACMHMKCICTHGTRRRCASRQTDMYVCMYVCTHDSSACISQERAIRSWSEC
jgi:hypothetical protein